MFDKSRCIGTIYALAKEKGIKIGDLEETAGVSKGYLSRINKEDSTSSPSIELLDSISRQLGVGIDYLVNFSHDTLSPNEQFVMQFIDKQMRMTMAGKLEWLVETSTILNAEDDTEVENPLVSLTKNYSDEANVWYDCHVYRSAIYEEGGADVSGACYHASITGGATVYLNCVTYSIPSEGGRFSSWNHEQGVIEVYLIRNGVQPICSTYYVAEELKKAVKDLYAAAASTPSKIALSHNTRSVMQSLINMKDE